MVPQEHVQFKSFIRPKTSELNDKPVSTKDRYSFVWATKKKKTRV